LAIVQMIHLMEGEKRLCSQEKLAGALCDECRKWRAKLWPSLLIGNT